MYWGKLALGLSLLAYALVQLSRGAAWDQNLRPIKRDADPNWFWFVVGTQIAAALFVIIGTILMG